MSNVTWINFLHIYQPAWQRPEIVRAVSEQSYAFLLDKLERYPNWHVTLNIAGVLAEQLRQSGPAAILERLRSAVLRGQVELVGSSYHHAFLPELPPHELTRQLSLQDEFIKSYIPGYAIRGCFVPEMGYNTKVGQAVAAQGYTWLILDPACTTTPIEPGKLYRDAATGLTIIFRDRALSKSYPPEAILAAQPSQTESAVVVTATDGELYGHFHNDWQQHLDQILAAPDVVTKTVSEYCAEQTDRTPITLQAASWETHTEELKRNAPFAMWHSHENQIHRKLWSLAHLAMDLLQAHHDDSNYYWARRHLDHGLSSCSWWWASEIKPGPFAPLAWNPDEILAGAKELITSIRSLTSCPSHKKIRAEKQFADLIQTVWTKHWQTYGTLN